MVSRVCKHFVRRSVAVSEELISSSNALFVAFLLLEPNINLEKQFYSVYYESDYY